jgi:hypothetical protein
MGELNKISIAAAERTQATTALMATGLVMKDEDREFLTNLSRMDGGEMKITVPASLMKELGLKEASLALKDLTPNQQKILLQNKVEFEKMNPKDMAMAQLTETQQMSRGIDVIASYFKVRGAEMARGVAKGTGGKEFEELRASIDNYSTTLTSSQKLTIEKDAEKFGGKVRTFFGDPITGIGNMISGKKQPESTPPPPPAPRETNVNFKFGPIPGYLDALGRDMLKNPNSLMLNIPGISNEYTTSKVAAGK